MKKENSDGLSAQRRRSEPAKGTAKSPAKRARPTSARKTKQPVESQRAHRAVSVWVVILTGIAMAFFAVWSVHWYITPLRGRGRSVRVDLPVEASAAEVTRRLWRAGVITRPWMFHALVLATRAGAKAHRGTVAFRDDLSPRAVLRVLSRGTAGVIRVTVPEGWSRYEIARRLDALGVCPGRDFLAATEEPSVLQRYGLRVSETPNENVRPTLEGMLFPDSYDFSPATAPEAVVERMTTRFFRRWKALIESHPVMVSRAEQLQWSTAPSMPPRPSVTGANTDGNTLSRGEYALVVLASMVERETGHSEDRAHVASVFWNRLTDPGFLPRLLQSDPTVTYGCIARTARGETLPGCNTVVTTVDGGISDAGLPSRRGAITTQMLADTTNPWNTYRREGLPPTPICNPGLAALEAVLSPTADRDLYFVATPDGRSAFAPTLDQHRQNVRRFLRSPR